MIEMMKPEEAKKIMDTNPEAIVLDVREQEEYKECHIPGSILLPLNEIEERAQEVIPNKEVLYLVHCRSGQRAMAACRKLTNLGYQDVHNFGGMMQWPYETVSENV